MKEKEKRYICMFICYEDINYTTLASNFEIKIDKSGKIFFYNKKTKNASFNPPSMKIRPINQLSKIKAQEKKRQNAKEKAALAGLLVECPLCGTFLMKGEKY